MANYIRKRTLESEIEDYTKFRFYGKRIQIPYGWAKKYSINEIKSNLKDLCGGNARNMKRSKIQAIIDDNPKKCGIDCSGFALRVANESTNRSDIILDFFSEIAYNYDSRFPINSSNEVKYKNGISAAMLTDLNNCKKIRKVEKIKPGDFIRFDDGAHIGIVKDVEKEIHYTGHTVSYIVTYAHSSGGEGPHEAKIIVPEGKALDDSSSSWSDCDRSYSRRIKRLFNYVCRPDCLD